MRRSIESRNPMERDEEIRRKEVLKEGAVEEPKKEEVQIETIEKKEKKMEEAIEEIKMVGEEKRPLEELKKSIEYLKETYQKLIERYRQILMEIKNSGALERMKNNNLAPEDEGMVKEFQKLKTGKENLERQIETSEKTLKKLEELEKWDKGGGKIKIEQELKIPLKNKEEEER